MTNPSDAVGTEILCVDDEPANLLAFEAVLTPLGVPVIQVGSGDAALQHVMRRGDAIAVILLDVHMPDLDGFETAKLVRGREAYSHLPIIFVTAINREEAHIVKGYAHGAVDYVVKPFNPEVLRAKVAFFVHAHRRMLAERHERLDDSHRLALAIEAGDLGVWTWSAATLDLEVDARCRSLLDLRADVEPTLAMLGLTLEGPPQDGHKLRGDLRTPSGKWLRSRARVYGEGPAARIVGVVADVSQEVQLQFEREMFVGVLGHDLRGPLTAIAMTGSMLEDHPDPKVHKAAARLARASDRMTMLVSNMLDLVASRAGRLSLERRAANLDAICRDVVSEIEATQPERRVELTPGNPRGGVWDPGRLGQIVHNLVANAIRHAEPDTAVRVAVRERGDDVELEVENVGSPIPEELRARIFEPFYSTSHGPGLGLYIVKRLVEAHGGRIEVGSDGGRTRFYVMLPREPSANAVDVDIVGSPSG